MLTLITPTGDRPDTLRLCSRWMARQDYDGPVQWIVVDDGVRPSPEPWVGSGWELDYVRRDSGLSGTPASLAKNVLAAIPLVKGEIVIMVEDDDYYAPDHLATMAYKLADYDAAGDGLQHYYHVPSMRWCELVNRGSSLAQTALKRCLLPVLAEACNHAIDRESRGVDARFWDLLGRRKIPAHTYTTPMTVCGIKGMPGRAGLGLGHRPDDTRGLGWHDDAAGEKLVEWTGDAAKEILELCHSQSNASSKTSPDR